MTIYSIKLAKKKDEAIFEQFMEEKIFLSVDKRQLRTGKINELVLLKGNNTGHTHEYLWIIYGGINGGAAVAHIENIKTFGTTVKLLRDYEECLKWSAEQT